jgi:flagellar FliJ protein
MKRFRLATVLRARQAREDAAKGAVLQARAAARQVELEITERTDDLGRRALPPHDTARAYLAAIVARQALAGELSAVRQIAVRRQAEVDERLTDFMVASQGRHAVEKLEERHKAEQEAAEAAAEQIAVDELATSRSRPPGTAPRSSPSSSRSHAPHVPMEGPGADTEGSDDPD